ncbi:hypothetical protein X777_07483 [Ooceraea biroi]|uniref:Uncharacterized protein n=1 Tax=Ooceraea biroi TaxID=2015173 RepID=A0A026X3M1_OOCBI|nr:hypothetical protein X777_07483 [Ooceraea biroi]
MGGARGPSGMDGPVNYGRAAMRSVDYSGGELGRFNPHVLRSTRYTRVGRWIDDVPRIHDQFPFVEAHPRSETRLLAGCTR